MKKLLLLIIIVSMVLLSSICFADIKNENSVRLFFDKHIEKVIKRDFEAAYLDYSPSIRAAYNLNQFKSMFEQQLEPMYGKLKSATFKSIEKGKKYELDKQYDIVTLFYKTEVTKPDTYIRAEVAEFNGCFYVAGFQYVNFTDSIPENLK